MLLLEPGEIFFEDHKAQCTVFADVPVTQANPSTVTNAWLHKKQTKEERKEGEKKESDFTSVQKTISGNEENETKVEDSIAPTTWTQNSNSNELCLVDNDKPEKEFCIDEDEIQGSAIYNDSQKPLLQTDDTGQAVIASSVPKLAVSSSDINSNPQCCKASTKKISWKDSISNNICIDGKLKVSHH